MRNACAPFLAIAGLIVLMLAPLAAGQAPVTSVVIADKSGQTTTNYPVTLSLVFKQGDVPGDAVTVRVDGQDLSTQTDAKVRYPDGSIKHALVSVLIPSLPAGGQVTAEILPGGVNANADPLDKDDVLATDFDAQMTITYGGLPTVFSARQMLTAAAPETWISGDICTEFLLKNFSVNVANQVNVQYRVRIYKDWPAVRVDAVVENCWSDYRGNIIYDFDLALGYASPTSVFSRTTFTHNMNARWHKVLWQGTQPGEVEVRYDLDYMIATGLLPRYDTSLVVPESTLAGTYSSWSNSSHDIMQRGIITQYFPTTGGRQEIGIYPTWAARYLLSMDNRLREISLNCGDLSGSIPIHVRESDPARPFHQHIISIDDRPTLWLGRWDFQWQNNEDRIPAPVGPTSTGWSVDKAHQASFAYVPYMVTGEYWYLEEMYFWAGWDLADSNPSYRERERGLIKDQVRGDAWAIRNVADAANLAPDGDIEKPYLAEKVANNIAYWTDKYVVNGNYPAVRFWGRQSNIGADGGRPDAGLDATVRYYCSPWQDDFVLLVLGHLRDIGLDTTALIDWLGESIINRFSHPDVNPYRGAPYHLPTHYNDGNNGGIVYPTWLEVNNAYVDDVGPADFPTGDYPSSYNYIARAAMTGVVHLPGGRDTWNWLDGSLHNKHKLAEDPTWAILPSAVAGDVDGDGHVNAVDLLAMAHSWNRSSGQAGFDSRCDFNGDGAVNALDLLVMAKGWGQ